MKARYLYHGPDHFSSRREVVIDEELALWLARMAVGEAGEEVSRESIACMCWAMLNRFFLHRARMKWRSFQYLVRRFSQPINPRWLPGGDLARKYAGTVYATPQKFRRRMRICSLNWGDMLWEIEEAIIDFEQGTLAPPTKVRLLQRNRISDWASHANLPKKFPWGIAVAERNGRKNWFFENKHLIPGHVVIDPWYQPERKGVK